MYKTSKEIKNRGSPNSSVCELINLLIMNKLNNRNSKEGYSTLNFIIRIFIEYIMNIMFQYIINYLNEFISSLI